MPAIQRRGDANSAGGVATSGVPSVRVNGRPVVIPNISVTPHPCCGRRGCAIHCSAVTTGGSNTVRAGGRPIIRATVDRDTCGHARAGGSDNVRIG
jgi:uncharacterized Zn-binding protein involved in type VI secretion